MHTFIRKNLQKITQPFFIFIFLLLFSFLNGLNLSYANEQEQKAHQGIHEYLLDNGLKLIVKEDHRAPVAINMIWYKVGSIDEPRGLGGISHMLEHMMFKGTKTIKPNEHSIKIANVGGSDNAFTSYDYTAYYEQIPVSSLALAFELEADRMANLNLQEEDFESERQVVAEERKLRTENSPQSKFMEMLNNAVWSTSPYRNPIIGWPQEISAWKLSDLQNWYQHFYAPNNATVVVVGDVNADEVFKLAQNSFGRLESRPTLTQPLSFEMPQYGKKEINVELEAQLPMLAMEYKIPSLKTITENHKDIYALMLLANILDGGNSARLPKELERGQEIAAYVSVDYNPYTRLDTTFSFYAIPQDNYTLQDLEKALHEQIQKLIHSPVDKEELKRAISRTSAGLVYQQDSMFYQAFELGLLSTIDLAYQSNDELLNQLKQITPEDIQNVAKKYLSDRVLTIGRLYPKKTGTETAAAAPINQQTNLRYSNQSSNESSKLIFNME